MTRAVRHPIAWLDLTLGEHRNRRLVVGVAALLACAWGRPRPWAGWPKVVTASRSSRWSWPGTGRTSGRASFGRALRWDIAFIGAYVVCGMVAAGR